jgi:endo-1,4-beta-xylanase
MLLASIHLSTVGVFMKVFRFGLVLPLFVHLLLTGATAQIPAGSTPLTANDILRNLVPTSSSAGSRVVAAEHPDFTQALRVEVLHEMGDPWSVEIRNPTTLAVKKGDVALIHFWARGAESSDETGEVFSTVYAQKAAPDWDKSIDVGFSVGVEWREFFFPFVFGDDYEPGQATIDFGIGSRRQTLELADFQVLHYGADTALDDLPRTRLTYAGRELDAAWREAAAERIRQNRQGPFRLKILDAAGETVPNAEIEVEMQRHAFLFGSALQMWRLSSDVAEDRVYRDKVKELFNAASNENALKWPSWDGDWGPGPFDRDKTMAGFAWLKENGLHRRGHVLVWPGWHNLPQSIKDFEGKAGAASAIPPLIIDHIDEITQATKNVVQEWDVLNEPYTNHDIMDLSGAGVMVDWFGAARRNLPETPLFINDYSILSNNGQDVAHQNHYEQTIQYLLDQGAPLDGIGMQGHFGDQVTPPEKVLSLLDRFGRFGLGIKITEFDINTTDQQLLNDYTRDFMTAVFSHPAVKGLQFWGFWEKAHWRSAAALYDADWNPRPHAAIYKDLVFDQWWTQVGGHSDAEGFFGASGFYGEYQVMVRLGDKEYSQNFTLAPDMAPVEIRLGTSTHIEKDQPKPGQYNLEQNYPNPFNPSTTIRYSLAAPTQVRLKVYNSLGQHIRTLVEGQRDAGTQAVVWDGRDQANRLAGSGAYIYELVADGFVQKRPMLLLY